MNKKAFLRCKEAREYFGGLSRSGLDAVANQCGGKLHVSHRLTLYDVAAISEYLRSFSDQGEKEA